MDTTTERILNRAADRRGLPAGLFLAAFAAAGVFYFGGVLFLASPYPDNRWIGWMYFALGLLYPLAAWASHVTWVDVGPDRLVVHRHSRSQTLRLEEIVGVEAHRHWQNPYGPRGPPPYYLIFRTRSGLPRQVQYIQPEAGDRLLFDLYRLRKPILVYNWQ